MSQVECVLVDDDRVAVCQVHRVVEVVVGVVEGRGRVRIEVYGVYRDWETDRKSTRLNSSHEIPSRMPSSA